ncbi:TPA: IS481 family transposase, partial [Corynebacterium striatum]|nr:IS481 family transposase [Corynebacterium striatum]
LRTDKVGTNGKTTLRWGDKLRRLYIGRRWGGEPITMVCVDNHVDIKITATGAQIAASMTSETRMWSASA